MFATRNCSLAALVVASLVLGAACDEQWAYRRQRSPFAARRAADDSRPLRRISPNQHSIARGQISSAESRADVVVGKFKAPAPEQMHVQRIPKSAQFGTQTMSASYRVADSEAPEKLVHGIAGASLQPAAQRQQQQQQQQSIQRTVSAKFQVSDEGLNYPPSKLSADIYGNVAEIVTAPPEAVENDFLLPNSRRFQGPLSRP